VGGPWPANERDVLQSCIGEVELPLQVPQIDVALDLLVQGVWFSRLLGLLKNLQEDAWLERRKEALAGESTVNQKSSSSMIANS